MADAFDPSLLTRLTAASYALPVEEALRDIADDVASWDAEGLPAREIDSRIRAWGKDLGFSYEDWLEELRQDMPELDELVPSLDTLKLYKAFKFEEWLIDSVRSLAFTDEPVPFYPLAAGFWLPLPNHDPPLLLGVMTPLSDPDLASKQVKGQFEQMFGKKAARKTKDTEVENARMLARHRQGMSYTEIAIQNLRGEFPDIIHRRHKYKAKIATERERVIKAIKAGDEVWKERLPDSSTD